jgi:17beta-estradiol 17-dehydrogenase / very-long-chain 3-oxoacyl-CoA reductase
MGIHYRLSDGIGRGFAEEFCQRWFNVILHGRNERKLDGVKAELSRQWPERQIRTLVNDAQVCDEATIAKLVSALERLCITVLVDNVGSSGPVYPTW